MTKKKFVSINEYAALCGRTPQAIYLRLKNKQLKSEIKSNGEYEAQVIDINEYPPNKPHRGRKSFKIA